MPGSSPGMTIECVERLPLHKLIPPIPLRVQQRREVAVVDPRGGRRRNRRLGVVGDAEPCRLDHAEIVGAVAGHQRVDGVEIEGFAELNQGCEFGRRGPE